MPGSTRRIAPASSFPEAFSLQGSIALVTGGGTGIGLAVARCLKAAGARVVITGRREGVLEEASQSLGDDVRFYVHDVTETASTPGLVERVTREVGTVDILVNNAGTHLKKPISETSEEEIQRLFQVHVTGAFTLTRELLPGMLKQGNGSVIFIASMASYLALPHVISYSVAKTAVLGMLRSFTAEYSSRGVRFNAVTPGWIETEMMAAAMRGDPERSRKVLSRIMTREFGRPEDVGWAVVYLSSPAAHYITGISLPVDGGALVGF